MSLSSILQNAIYLHYTKYGTYCRDSLSIKLNFHCKIALIFKNVVRIISYQTLACQTHLIVKSLELLRLYFVIDVCTTIADSYFSMYTSTQLHKTRHSSHGDICFKWKNTLQFKVHSSIYKDKALE